MIVAMIAMVLFLGFFACGDDGDDDDNDDSGPADDDDDDAVDDDDDNDDQPWEPVAPHRETREHFTVVWLAGTAYEMGYQQGELMHDELAAEIAWLNAYHLVDILIPIANWLGLIDLARDNSYPDIIDECKGLSDAAGDVGFTMDVCLLLNFGDVLVEFLNDGFPEARNGAPGCSQFAAIGDATADGRLYHGRILDWSKIQPLIDYPVVFVRQPSDGIPHAYIGFPGNLSPYSGINAEGITSASNEAIPADASQHDATGHSHVQMQGQLLKRAHDLDEARTLIETEDHMSVEILMVADGKSGRAAVFEMSSQVVGVRELTDDVLWVTNHFVSPEAKHASEAYGSSTLRFDRLQQLVSPDGEDTVYGHIDPETAIEIMRDRVNPYTKEETPDTVFDNDSSLATNGALYQIVFDPENLLFWVAAGALPVPNQKFVGFSLGELLGLPGAVAVEPNIYP